MAGDQDRNGGPEEGLSREELLRQARDEAGDDAPETHPENGMHDDTVADPPPSFGVFEMILEG